MVVKINGQVVEQKAIAATELEAAPQPPKEKVKSCSAVKVMTAAAVAALVIAEPSFAHAATVPAVAVQESGDNMFQDFVIKSLTVDVTIGAILFAFKRQWAKTFAWASGIIYGGYFCAETAGMALAVFFTWLNHTLQHWLEIVRMG